MKWFRLYSEVRYDPKLLSVRPELRWLWLSLLCVASEQKPRGRVPFSDQDVRSLATLLGQKPDRLATYVGQLVRAGLFDVEDGCLIPHGWNTRQFASDNVTERVVKHRERNVSETPPDTDNRYRDTDTEEEPLPQTPSPPGLKLVNDIFSLYEQVFGPRLTPRMVTVLKETEKEYDANWIEEAFKEAAIGGARSWRYVEAILQNWKAEEEGDMVLAREAGLEGKEAIAFAETTRADRQAR